MPESPEPLDRLRERIDQLDERIVELLGERARVVMEIGRTKRSTGAPTYAPDREREVLDRLKSLNRGPLSERTLVAIYLGYLLIAMLAMAGFIAFLGG